MDRQQLSTSSLLSSCGFDSHSSSHESSLTDDGVHLPQRKHQKSHCSCQLSWKVMKILENWLDRVRKDVTMHFVLSVLRKSILWAEKQMISCSIRDDFALEIY